jgi:hypothetical protein
MKEKFHNTFGSTLALAMASIKAARASVAPARSKSFKSKHLRRDEKQEAKEAAYQVRGFVYNGFTEHEAIAASMTNWQRKKWAAGGYKGGYKKDRALEFAKLERPQ